MWLEGLVKAITVGVVASWSCCAVPRRLDVGLMAPVAYSGRSSPPILCVFMYTTISLLLAVVAGTTTQSKSHRFAVAVMGGLRIDPLPSSTDSSFGSLRVHEEITIDDLVAEATRRGCSVRRATPGIRVTCSPSGLVFDNARSNRSVAASAAISSLLLATGHVTTFDVSILVDDMQAAAEAAKAPANELVRALQAVAAAISDMATHTHTYLFASASSTNSLAAHTALRAALPDVPWLALYEQPQCEGQLLHGADRASLVRLLLGEHPAKVTAAPMGAVDSAVPREQVCSAAAAMEVATLLTDAAKARDRGLRRAAGTRWSTASRTTDAGVVDSSSVDAVTGPLSAAAVSAFLATTVGPRRESGRKSGSDDVAFDDVAGTLLDRQSGRGVIAGVGQGVLVPTNDAAMAASLLAAVLVGHLRPKGVVSGESDGHSGVGATWTRDHISATLFVKFARTSDSPSEIRVAGDAEQLLSSNVVQQRGIDELRACEGMHAATRKFFIPIEEALKEFHGRNGSSDVGDLPSLRASVAASAPPQDTDDADFDVRLLPIGGGYPALYPLREILHAWNPDIT